MIFNLKVDQRTKRQYKNITYSFFFRGITVLSSFLLVPLCLTFLTSTTYGTWLTIYSILGWTTLFDFGLGNGMKNKLSEALAYNDTLKARIIVSNNYFLLSAIIIALLLTFLFVNQFLNWNQILNVPNNVDYLAELILICFAFSLGKLLLDSINSILHAYQKTALVTLITLVSSICSLTAVYVITTFNPPNHLRLVILGSIIAGMPVVISAAFNIYFFCTEFKHIRPSIALIKKNYIQQIFSIGGQFFVIQIAALVIFSTDSLLVAHIFAPDKVTVYNISYKLFSSFTIIWTLIITPYWTAFNEAFIRKDIPWVKKTVKNLLLLWVGIVILIFITLLFVNDIYTIWLDSAIYVPLSLSFAMAIFVAISTFSNIFSYFVNGIGKIRLQLITSVTAAIINVPLAIYFSKNLDWGLSGIIAATCVSLSIGAIAIAIQYYKIIYSQASGLWNK